MHAFQFRLEPLLKYRRMLEEQANIKLAEITAIYLHEKDCFTALETCLSNHLNMMRSRQSQPITVAALKMLQDYHDKVKKDLIIQSARLEEAESQRQESLHLLEEAMKARKVVEKLRERRLLQYQTEMLQDEQKHLDELGLQAFSRR